MADISRFPIRLLFAGVYPVFLTIRFVSIPGGDAGPECSGCPKVFDWLDICYSQPHSTRFSVNLQSAPKLIYQCVLANILHYLLSNTPFYGVFKVA